MSRRVRRRSNKVTYTQYTVATRDRHWGACMKFVAVFSALAVVGVAGGSIIAAFTKTADRNAVDLEYGSVMTRVEEGEKFSIDQYNGYAVDPNGGDDADINLKTSTLAAEDPHGYTAVGIFARLNWNFAQQTRWNGEYHGKVNTVVEQDVQTYKYYKDGMLLSADLTTSSLVNSASQFCYLKDQDRVIWRKPVGGPSTYNGMDTEWSTGEPYSSMTISGEDGFKSQNGLPAYELSVYVIEGRTVESADVVELDDGRFKVTFVMNPKNWTETDENGNEIVKGANAYYINQMIFTGGLPEAPTFSSLTVSFIFDENWVTYASEVSEAYSAAYGPINAPCTAWGKTEYEYGNDLEFPTAYEDYFQHWADAEIDVAPPKKEITAVNCLAEAFGGLLAHPSALTLDLTVNGEKQSATAFLDLSKTDLSAFDLNALEARVGLGALNIWIENGKAYVKYGDLKVSLSLGELVGFFTSSSEGEAGGGLDTDALLAALGEGQFIVSETSAELHSVLPLLGLDIPVDFYFAIDGEQKITLDRAEARIEAGGQTIGAVIKFGGTPIAALGEEEKAAYPELMPYIAGLKDVFSSDFFRLDIGYNSKDISVMGAVDIAKSPLAVQGSLTVSLPAGEASKTLRFLYREGDVCLDLDGIKIKANVADAVELIKQYADLPDLGEGLSLDLGKLVSTVLSEEFAANLSSREEDSAFRILVRGTELLGALGLEFDLGDLSVTATPNSLALGALGATLSLTAGDPFEAGTAEGYTDLLPYAAQIAELVAGGFLHADVTYSSDTLSVSGGLDLDIRSLSAKAQFTLSYAGSEKTLDAIYANGALYLTVDGLHIKADAAGAVELVGQFVDLPESGDATDLVSKLFSLDFSELLSFGEEEETLRLTVAGTELLTALGLDFDLGSVELTVGGGRIGVSAMNATVEIAKGNAFSFDTAGYAEIVPYAETLIEIYRSGYLHADLSYEIAGLTIGGEADLDLQTFDVAAALTLSYKSASKKVDILYTQGNIFIGVDQLRLSVNAEEAAALLSDFIRLENNIEAEAALSALFAQDFSELIPELWESDDVLHITLASGKLLELFGLEFDLGDVRLAVDGDGATIKLGSAVITAHAGKAFEKDTENYLDITQYLNVVNEFAGAEALTLDVAYNGEDLTISGAVDIMLDGSAAKGDLTLAYRNKENQPVDHALFLLYSKEENALYLSIDGVKVKADVDEALSLIKELVRSDEKATQGEKTRRTRADEDMGAPLDEEALTVLEKLLSFDLGKFFALTERTEEEGGVLSLTVKGTELLSALGASFDLGDVKIELDQKGHIALSAIGGKLTLAVRAGETFEKTPTDGYIDIVKYGRDLADLFSNRTYKIAASYADETFKVRADVSFDTTSKIVEGDLILIYNSAAKEASFVYENGYFYLDLGGTYKIKTKTAGAVALIAGYLGLSETEGVEFQSLTKALDVSLDGLLTLGEKKEGEVNVLTVLLDGTALLKALGVNFDLGNVDLQIAADFLYVSVKGVSCEVTGSSRELSGLQSGAEADYTDLSEYVDSLVNVFKHDYLTLTVSYDDGKGVAVNGKVCIDMKGKQARADIEVTANGMDFRLGIAYDEGGVIYLDLDGAKIKAQSQELLDLIKDLFTKKETSRARQTRAVRTVADTPAPAALTEEQKSKLLDVLETLLSLNLDDYFELAESGEKDSLTLTVQGTELLSKLLKKDVKLGEVTVKVEKNGGLTLTVLGAEITATGGDTAFTLFDEGDGKDDYADVVTYVGYLTELFKSENLKLHIEKLTVQAGETEISASGDIEIKTDGTLAGGTLTLKAGEKSFTLTLYYEKADENILYIKLGEIKLQASIEGIKALVEKLQNKQPAAARALRIAAAVAEGSLFGVDIGEEGTFSLAADGEKLMKLFGSDIKLGEIGLEIAEGQLGISLTAEKFSLDATLSAATSITFDTPENKADYIDVVKYLDFAVELFRNRTYTVDVSYQKGEFTLAGKVLFDTTDKTATASLNLGYKNANKHVDLIYKDSFLYLTLAREEGKDDFKFKANTASAVALILGYLGVSGTGDLPSMEMPEDVFADLFQDFDDLIALSEEKDVLTILLDGTQLFEKLKVSLGDFKLGDIGVQLQKDSLTLSVLEAHLTVSGSQEPLSVTLNEADYTDLSEYVDSLVNVFKHDYLTLTVSYDDGKGVAVNGKVCIDMKGKQARADIEVTANGMDFRLGIAYDEGGVIYLDLDGAKIKAQSQELLDLIKDLFTKKETSRARQTRAVRTVADTPAPAALTEEQKSKLLDVLETLLSLNLDDYFELAESGEKDSLTLTVQGTELLSKLLKKDVKLGEVTVKVEKNGGLTLTVLGAKITATGSDDAFPLFDEGEGAENYTDVLQYVQWASAIFSSKAKAIGVTIKAGELTIDVTLDVVEGNTFMKGTIELGYRSASQTFNFIYNRNDGEDNTEGWLYLDLGGVKVKAKTEDIVALFKSVFSSVSGSEAGKTETIAFGYAVAVISEAETISFESFDTFSLTEEGGVLMLSVSGKALMSLLGEKVQSLLGEKFALESVGLSVSEKKFSVSADASASGKDIALDVSVSKSEKDALTDEDTKDLSSYIDVFKYGRMVKEIFASNTLQAELTATIGGQKLTLSLKFKKDFSMAQGTLSIGTVDLDLIYVLKDRSDGTDEKDVVIYLQAGNNVKLMANVSEVIRIIKDEKAKKEARGRIAPIALSDEDMDTLERLLTLNFGKVFELKETLAAAADESDSLAITVATADLLNAFGVNFDLGNVMITIEEGSIVLELPDKVRAELYGATKNITIAEPEKGEYHDITPIVKRVVDLIEAQAIEFAGELSFGDTNIVVEQAVFTWREDEEKQFYLKGGVGDLVLELSIVGEHAKLKVGSFGIEFNFSDIGDLIDGIKALVERVKTTIGKVKENISGKADRAELITSLEGVVKVLNNLIDILKGGEEAAGAAASARAVYEGGGLLLAPAALKPDDAKEMLLSFTLGKIAIDLFDETGYEERGLLGVVLTVGDKSAPVLTASVDTAVFKGTIPELTGEFYQLSEFTKILGFVGDAVALVAEPTLTAQIGGSVTSTNTAMYTSGLKYNVTGNMQYASGGSFPVHIDMDGNNLWVNAGLFVHFKLFLEAGETSDNSLKNLYLDILILDVDPSGKEDDTLDFYITVSEIGDPTKTGYDPLKLYAPADEVMTILSSVAAMTGLDAVTYVNEYLIRPWIDEEMVARFNGLGESLIATLINSLLKDDGQAAEGAAAIANGETVPADVFGITFDGLTLNFRSETDEEGVSRLTLFGVENAWNGDKTEKTDLTFEFSREEIAEQDRPADVADYFLIEGVDELLLALARTATHGVTADGQRANSFAETARYVREENFYIDGSISLKANLSFIPGLSLVNYDIQDLAVEVIFDENAKVGLKLHYKLPRLHEVVDIINADTEVDFMLNGGMVFIKRVVTTDSDGKALPAPEVIYRAMPLENFSKTALEQINFMFNFGSTIADAISGSSGGGTTTAEAYDLGALFRSYVTQCSYHFAENGDHSWQLVINGETLTKNVNQVDLHEITVDLGLQEKLIRTLGLKTSVSLAGILEADVEGALRLRNPQGLMDEGVERKTTDIETPMRGGMADAIESADWTAKNYLEGEYTEVTYMLGDEKIGEPQGIFFDRTTKQFYTSLKYPEFTEEQLSRNLGHTLKWQEIAPEDYKPGMTVYARYSPNTYRITLESEIQFEGAELGSDGIWRKVVEWTFTSSFAFPAAADGKVRIVGFTFNGDELETSASTWEFLRALGDGAELIFTAACEDIVYTVTFDMNGTTKTATGKYGETIPYPDTDDTKTGYSFEKWSETLATFGEIWDRHGNVTEFTVTASYTPNTYTVTLVSDYMITFDGFNFEERGDGQYYATYSFIFDTEVKLPTLNDGTQLYVLNGFTLDGDETNTTYTQIPNVARDMVLTAVWAERGVDVVFGEETVNRHIGETIQESEIPAAPAKDGYRAYWTLNGEELSGTYTLNEEDIGEDGKITFEAGYEAITYTVTVRSAQPVSGFAEDEDGYYKTYSYTFDSSAQTLDKLASSGYDFVDYTYNGTAYSQIDSALIAAFGYKDGTLTVEWKNNIVNVTFYSDFNFEGSEKQDSVSLLYSKTVEYKDGSYAIGSFTLAPTTRDDIQQLGWWYQDGATWRNVTNVQEFVSENADESTVSLYAMWIENITVGITNFSQNNLIGDSATQYIIVGTVRGGLPAGMKSEEIYGTVGISKKATGYYVLYNTDGSKSDSPGGSEEITITYEEGSDVGTFSSKSMNSATFSNLSVFGAQITPLADFGGLLLTMTFTYGDNLSISTFGGRVVSLATYSVRYVNEKGETLDEKNNVRVGYEGRYECDKVDIDFSKLTIDNTVRLKDLFPDGVAVPAKEGYTGYWMYNGQRVTGDEKVTGDMNIQAVYTVNSYAVEFTSENGFADCEEEAKSYLQGTKELPYGTQISFVADGTPVEGHTYTVGLENNIFAVPAMVYSGAHAEGYTGKWQLTETAAGKLTFTAVYEANLYDVTFTSDHAVEGWQQEGDGWTYSAKLLYGLQVTFSLTDGSSVGEVYTVKAEEGQICALPAFPVYRENGTEYPDVQGYWTAVIDEDSAAFTAVYRLNTVYYKSENAFATAGGESMKEATHQVLDVESYDLIDVRYTPDDETLEFAGWYNGDTEVTRITSDMFVDGQLTLTAKWVEKPTLKVNFTGESKITVTYTDEKGEQKTITENGTYYIKSGTVVSYTISSTAQDNGRNKASWSWSITNAASGNDSKNGDGPMNNATGSFTMPSSGTQVQLTATSSNGSCIVEGTLIMLADGTQKPVEEITAEDEILIFNHETGKYEAGKMWYIDHADMEREWHSILYLSFSDGTEIGISYRHAFFDLDLNKYVYLQEDNYAEYFGHSFANVSYVEGEFVSGSIELVSAEVRMEYVRVYGPISEYHFNMVNAGLLSMPSFSGGVDGLMNYFEYGEGMKYDEEKMQADIEQYGVFTYEDFAEYISEEDFNKTPAKWLKVAIGKGMLTMDEILWSIQYLYQSGGFTE